MAARLSARQWSALRELAEGELSTYPRLAGASGVSAKTLRERAAKEGWKKLDFRKGAVQQAYRAAQQVAESPNDGLDKGSESVLTAPVDIGDTADDNLGRLSRLLSRQAGSILTSAEAQHGILNKAQLDALSSLIKLAEKLGVVAQEQVGKKQTRSDAEIAAVLERIDDRIVELAEEHAERLGAEKSDR